MNNPLKGLGNLNKLRQQAQKMQAALKDEEILVEKGDVRVVISGDQKVKNFSVQGFESQEAVDALNEAIKKSQQLAAKKLQEIAMQG